MIDRGGRLNRQGHSELNRVKGVRYPPLKGVGLDLYSTPRKFPMSFRSHRLPDAVPSFQPRSREMPAKPFLPRVEESVHGHRSRVGRLFTEGLFPPTRSSFLTKAGSSNCDRTGNGPVLHEYLFILTSEGAASSHP